MVVNPEGGQGSVVEEGTLRDIGSRKEGEGKGDGRDTGNLEEEDNYMHTYMYTVYSNTAQEISMPSLPPAH